MQTPTPTSDRSRIRELFRRTRGPLRLADAAALLRLQPEVIAEAVAEGSVQGIRSVSGDTLLSWDEVLALGLLRRWTPRLFSTALPPALVPRLARSVLRRVALPRYQWDLLSMLASEKAAAEDREFSVADLLEETVHHTHVGAIEDWASIEEQIPGIHMASEWPLAWEEA